MTAPVPSAVEWTGSYVPPDSHEIYEVQITPEEQQHWMSYMPTVIAVVNSGAVDTLIYEIAKACHERHVITGGRATALRPARPHDRIDPATIQGHKILSPSNQLLADSMATPYFTYQGHRYGKNRAVGRFFTIPTDSMRFATELHGAFVQIIEAGQVQFVVKIVGGAAPATRLGDSIKVRYTDVPELFGV